MMLQVIEGKIVYVVDFDTMPELPIKVAPEEETYLKTLYMGGAMSGSFMAFNHAKRFNYAAALTDAIETGVITEPGKYGIHLMVTTGSYAIFKIIEE